MKTNKRRRKQRFRGSLFFTATVLLAALSADGLSRMPSGPAGAGRFGAYYTTLQYDGAWDNAWRIGAHADIVVRFDKGAHRFVFWRGTSYIPCWVTDTGIWYTNEFVERRGSDSPNTQGCCEPMSDKQCRYSHVRIIESSDARAVVHWRYAPMDVHYNHPFIDPESGWSDWVDEYYYIYPDAVGVRQITVHTSAPEKWMEWQEAIVINQPGTMPEDNIQLAAVSVASMSGESTTFTWTEEGAPDFNAAPKDANILRVNLRSSLSPFAIVPSVARPGGRVITPYKGHGKGSFFNFWNHWPVSTDASDTRLAESDRTPSHSSLAHTAHRGGNLWRDHAQGDNWRTRIMLHGMTSQDVAGLVPLAKSWEHAPRLILNCEGYGATGYSQAERAYQLRREDSESGPLEFSILADSEHPLVNPAFVIKNWGDEGAGVRVTLNGHDVERGTTLRFGYHSTIESVDLIVWLEMETTDTVDITIEGI